MKLASLKSGRDGQLCVVNRALTQACLVTDIAPTLQSALDQWEIIAPSLQKVYERLNTQKVSQSFAFDPALCAAPLPRAYQWADGSAYVNHVELVRKARNAEMPKEFWTDPLMYQGGSDTFLGPHDPISVIDEAYGIDFESEIAVITGDVPMAITAQAASACIKLLMLVNDVSLRNLIPAELAKGFGFFQSKPSSSFSPVAVTPDELETAWDGQKVHLPLLTYYNEQLFGQPNAGIDMTFSFPQLIAHAAKTRSLGAGTIIGSGTVSNVDRSVGSSCIAEKRMLEILATGQATTPFMRFGDTIRIEMYSSQKQNIFGSIQQTVVPYAAL
ncbi:MAG TPA: fumarylacetoacetate hydrolase family protein [Legionellaceae bacterium]|nr:fumarylacetoacetate hydrolase family protein [Legionellaceae bacterium]